MRAQAIARGAMDMIGMDGKCPFEFNFEPSTFEAGATGIMSDDPAAIAAVFREFGNSKFNIQIRRLP